MKKTFLILLLFLLTNTLFAQVNLVPNGDFEIYSSLPTSYGQANLASGWNNVNGDYTYAKASPDYFNLLSLSGSAFGAISPYSGNGQMGLITYENNALKPYREYISTQLTVPMIPNHKYTVSFYLTNGVKFLLGTNNFGIHFSTNPLYQATWEPIPVMPQIEIDSIIYFYNYWQHFSFDYRADSSYNIITIGNFKDDAHTFVSTYGSSTIEIDTTTAYYFIDKIEIYNIFTILGDTNICKGNLDTLRMYGDSIVKWADSLNPSTILATDSMIIVSPSITTTYMAFTNYDTTYFTVYMVNPPVINLGNDTTICNALTLLLNATSPYGTYLWQDNSTSPTYTVTSQGTYWVKVSINSSCFTIDSIQVNYSSYPDVFLGNDTTLCTGDTLILNATLPNVTYQWQDGSTSPFYTVTQQGMYWVKTTNQYNCHSYNSIIVSYNPTPNIPTISPNGNVITSSSALGNQWLLNGQTILGDTNQSYTIPSPITDTSCYSVTVTNIYGCSATSNTVCFYPLGISEVIDNGGIFIYPNPAKEILTIETNLNTEQRIEIINIVGQTVYTNIINKKATVNTSAFASGVYILKLYTDKETVVKKFVKE